MDHFIVSARKYRPSTFHSVVGQAHVTVTLRNAIRNGHLAQAFLFCGPRGVGKTTCARILAKTVNCSQVTDAIEPCNACPSCLSFNNGQSFNITELDAASNNSVEDIRSLIDQVRFAPQMGSHRVFIIDEVHMLSNAAFNAFLKTLEEPPPHAIFILATTEKHKIIPTILSRCQIFDFHRIRVEDIASHLEHIAQSEGVPYDPEALHLIAQKADGGLRDACSMFDQLVTFSGNNVTYQAVLDNLNILDYDYYFRMCDALLAREVPAALKIFQEILSKGFDGHNFISGLAEHLRNLMVAKDAETLSLLEVGKNIKERYREQAQRCDLFFLFNGINHCTRTDAAYKQAKNQRLLVELCLMQIGFFTGAQAQGPEKKNDSGVVPSSIPSSESPVSPVVGAPTPSEQVQPNAVLEPGTSPAVSAPAEPLSQTIIAAPAAPRPALPNIPRLGVPGIQSFMKSGSVPTGTESDQSHPTLKADRKQAFSEEDLCKAWDVFTQAQQGSGFISSTLSARKPKLVAEDLVRFPISNAAQREALQPLMPDLAQHLRDTLTNDFIKVQLELSAEDEVERKPYTNSEKFEVMMKENPVLAFLKSQLDLEI
jgi:DNA polymerase-3 subunit gamma/tau